MFKGVMVHSKSNGFRASSTSQNFSSSKKTFFIKNSVSIIVKTLRDSSTTKTCPKHPGIFTVKKHIFAMVMQDDVAQMWRGRFQNHQRSRAGEIPVNWYDNHSSHEILR